MTSPKPYAEHCDKCDGTGRAFYPIASGSASLEWTCDACAGTGRRIHHPSESGVGLPDETDALQARARAAEERAAQLQAELTHAREKVRQMAEAGDAMSLLIGSLRTNANPDGPSPAAGYVAAWEKTKGGK